MISPFQSSLLSSQPLIKHGFFTRKGGCSTELLSSLNMRLAPPEQEKNFQENCRRVYSWFDLDISHLVLMQQVHGDQVAWIDKKINANSFKADSMLTADALLTQDSGLILGVRTADCIPVLLYDPVTLICGVIHVGWRGALLNIIAKTLKMMFQRGSCLSQVYAVLGPCIQAASFEIDMSVQQAFLKVNLQYKSFFKAGCDLKHFWFDLPGLALFQLRSQGVINLESLSIDTYQEAENFYSYRRSQHALEKTYGTQISAIVLL